MEELRLTDSSLFEKADYGKSYSAAMSYVPSAAWTWMVCGEKSPPVLLYNDI
jgi:hypothetical protein